MSSTSENRSKDLPKLPAPPYRSILLIMLAFGLGYTITRVLELSHSTPVTGHLYSKSTAVYATETGVIQKFLTRTGELADETSSLCVIQNITLTKQLKEQTKRVLKLKQNLKVASAKSEIELAWRNKSLENEILQTRLNAANYLQEKYNQQIEKYAWKKYLNRPRPVSHLKKPDEIFRTDNGIHDLDRFLIRAQLEQESAQNAEEVTTVQLRLCEKRLDSLKKLKKELPQKLSDSFGITTIQNNLSNEEKKLAALKQREIKQDIKANAYGIVGPMYHSSGETINKGEKLLDIYHMDHLFIKASFPSLMATKVQNGTEVRLYFPNGEKRKGRIKHKSFIAAKDASNSSGAPEVEIIVEPFGKNWPEVAFGTAIQIQTL